MPYLKMQTNKGLGEDEKFEIASKMSKKLAELLGKPEQYIMTAIEDSVKMSFAGTSDATLFMELKSIGLDESLTADFSKSLCEFTEKELGVAKERVYIEFSDAKGSMWGWNGKTF